MTINIIDYIFRTDVNATSYIPKEAKLVYSSTEYVDGLFTHIQLLQVESAFFLDMKYTAPIHKDNEEIEMSYNDKFQVINTYRITDLLAAISYAGC